ncbi:MAG: nicotinate (nicotinamide) nucleotide adenylyltransferase [Alicyclobacillus sp.]|nr:nicotinate (nicotinamide) nucleotide adenylyltransferase [Alicyclobacillus sp.]
MKRVVLFGGTFDPPHIAHLSLAQFALERADCDEVWLIPAADPPHKTGRRLTPYTVRRAMVQTLIQGYPGLCVCDVEAQRQAPSFTLDTVRILCDRHPEVAFQWLIGADSLHDLPTWHGSVDLAALVPFLVAARSGYPFADTLAAARAQLPQLRAERLECPQLDISSSQIRQRLQRGLPACGWVPEGVLQLWQAFHGAASSQENGREDG